MPEHMNEWEGNTRRQVSASRIGRQWIQIGLAVVNNEGWWDWRAEVRVSCSTSGKLYSKQAFGKLEFCGVTCLINRAKAHASLIGNTMRGGSHGQASTVMHVNKVSKRSSCSFTRYTLDPCTLSSLTIDSPYYTLPMLDGRSRTADNGGYYVPRYDVPVADGRYRRTHTREKQRRRRSMCDGRRQLRSTSMPQATSRAQQRVLAIMK